MTTLTAAYDAIIDALPDEPTDAEMAEANRQIHALMGMTDVRIITLPDGGTVTSYCHPGDDLGHLFAEGWATDIAMASD